MTRWQRSEVPRGDDYDARWRKLAASGQNVHGEADLVESLLRESGGTSVLDAGCGTGRVAIELAGRGFSVVGVDADAPMLAAAKSKAPDLSWVEADLADLGSAVPGPFDLALLAGNVMIFLEPGTEARALAALAARLSHGGLLGGRLQCAGRPPDTRALRPARRYRRSAARVPMGDMGPATVRGRRLRGLGAPADPLAANLTGKWTSADGVR